MAETHRQDWDENPHGWKTRQTDDVVEGSTEAHRVALSQEYHLLRRILRNDASLVHARDQNGWTPLHEAVRGHSEAIVKFLVDKGADVNAPTEYGETPLEIATEFNGENHPIVNLLKSLGAKMGPEL